MLSWGYFFSYVAQQLASISFSFFAQKQQHACIPDGI